MQSDRDVQIRRNILFMSQCLPYPPFSGVTRRTYNILDQLAKSFNVTLLPFYRKNHQKDEEALRAARDALESTIFKVLEPVPITSEQARWRFAWSHLRSVVTRRPYTYYEYGSRRFLEQLENETDGRRFDLVHFDSMDLYRWFDHLTGVPVACTHHSIESALLGLRAERLGNPFARMYLRWQARQLECVEREYAPRVTINLMMSAVDAQRLEQIAPKSRTFVVPNGVDTSKFSVSSSSPADLKSIVFLGPLYMYPNWDGIRFFVHESWPNIRAAEPDARLTLIGKASREQISELESANGVRVLGFVDDVRPTIAAARCCIAPLRIGGGTRLKILEYWAMGKPVVSTSIGCEGLAAKDEDNILLRDDAAGLASAVLRILSDPDFASSLGRSARATVEANYTWDRIGSDLRRLYQDLIINPPT